MMRRGWDGTGCGGIGRVRYDTIRNGMVRVRVGMINSWMWMRIDRSSEYYLFADGMKYLFIWCKTNSYTSLCFGTVPCLRQFILFMEVNLL